MKVWYLDHSAVAVKTEKHLLLFDLAGKVLSGQPGEGLAEGCVNPDEIKDEDVLVFVSHEHKDHFDPAIFSLREKLSRVRFVLPEELDEVYQADLFVSAEEEQCKHYALPDCRVTTFASTDIGVAYLLEIDGLLIEGGATLNWSALEAGLARRVYAYIAPKLLGGTAAKSPIGGLGFPSPGAGTELSIERTERLGDDILLECEVKQSCSQE